MGALWESPKARSGSSDGVGPRGFRACRPALVPACTARLAGEPLLLPEMAPTFRGLSLVSTNTFKIRPPSGMGKDQLDEFLMGSGRLSSEAGW